MEPAVAAMLAALRRLRWLVGLLAVGPAAAQTSTYTARVRWQPIPAPSVAGYRVYSGGLSGAFGSPLDAGKPAPAADGTMSFLVPGLDATVGHAFAVTAYTSDGQQSAYSNQLTLPASSTTPSSCGRTPEAGCQPAAARSSPLLLGKGKLKWRWTSSAAVATSDFGDPAATTDYRLCIYDASGEGWSALAPAGGTCGGRPCWKALGSVGFRYGDRDALPDGLTKMLLAAGTVGRARIQVRGGTANLPLPSLPFTTPVRVQLQRADGGACWEATYGSAVTDGPDGFKAKSD
jgi:hypothetical protein